MSDTVVCFSLRLEGILTCRVSPIGMIPIGCATREVADDAEMRQIAKNASDVCK